MSASVQWEIRSIEKADRQNERMREREWEKEWKEIEQNPAH